MVARVVSWIDGPIAVARAHGRGRHEDHDDREHAHRVDEPKAVPGGRLDHRRGEQQHEPRRLVERTETVVDSRKFASR